MKEIILIMIFLIIIIIFINYPNLIENFQNENTLFGYRSIDENIFKTNENDELRPVNSENPTVSSFKGKAPNDIINKFSLIKTIAIEPVLLKDDKFVKNSIMNLISAFNNKMDVKFSLLSIGDISTNEKYYEFNAFISDFISDFTTVSTFNVKIQLNLQGTNVVDVKSNYIQDPNEFAPVKNTENKITDSTGFFKIKNSLGLFYPYQTSADEMLLTKQNKIDNLKKISDFKNQKYTCFGKSNLNSEKECKIGKGIWGLEI